MVSFASLVFISLNLFGLSYCLYEDQIEKFDWRQQFLGRADFYALGQHGLDERLFVASDAHVLGAIEVTNGTIAWRQPLEEAGRFLDVKLCGKYLVSISSLTTTLVRVWDAKFGTILKEFSTGINSSRGIVACSHDKAIATIVLTDRIVTLKLASQEMLLETKAPMELQTYETVLSSLSQSAEQSEYLFALLSGTKHSNSLGALSIRLSSVDESAFQMQHWTFEKPASNIASCLLHGSPALRTVVCHGKDTLFSGELRPKQAVVWKQTALPAKPLKLTTITAKHIFVSLADGKGCMLVAGAAGQYSVSFSLPDVLLAVPLHGVPEPATKFAVFQQAPRNSLSFGVYDVTSGRQVSPAVFSKPLILHSNHGGLEGAVVIPNNKQALLFTEDHAIHLFSNDGNRVWLREESLSHITAVEMFDLPVSPQQATMEDEFGNVNAGIFQLFANRLHSQAKQLKNALGNLVSSLPFKQKQPKESEADVPETSSNDADFDDDQPLTRDVYNLHKMIVVVTSIGKVFGMESAKGQIMWSYLVPDAQKFNNGAPAQLFLQRTTGHFPLRPIASVLLQSKSSGLPILFTFDPITGSPLNRSLKPATKHDVAESLIAFSDPILQALLIPGPVSEKTGHIRPLCIIHKDLKVSIFPPSLASRTDLLPAPFLYLYTMEASRAVLRGFRVFLDKTSPPSLSAGQGEAHYVAQPIWHMALSSKDIPQHIIASSVRPANEHIYSIGRVLGDRNVLYKYVNPNLLAVMTLGESALEKVDIVSLYLIDVVVGKVIHSAVHRRCNHPVSLLVSENWVLYSMYNQRSLRSEFTILELFEPARTMSALVPSPWELFVRSMIPANWQPQHQQQQQQEQCAKQGGHDAAACVDGNVFSSAQRAANSAFDSPKGSAKRSSRSSAGGDPGLLVPEILQRSYILASPIRPGAVTVTLTERGITAKSLLFGLETGNLLELPKSLLDPRRTLDVTPELQEEGLEPYSPELPLSTYAVISYNKTLERIRQIRTAPSGLESTSLVFAHGLDIFFTRVAPSKTYDLLRDDFDHWFIAMITAGMLVGAFVAKYLAARKELNKAWQ